MKQVLFFIFLIAGIFITGCSQPEKTESGIQDIGNMKLSSLSFKNNEMISSEYTCDDADISPELIIEDVPAEAKSLSLIVDDPELQNRWAQIILKKPKKIPWIIAPWIVSLIVVPDLPGLLNSVPINNLIWPYIFGVLWGIGGLTFGLTMRFLGMSLGMAMALGLTAAFGTLVPPVYFGQFGDLISHTSGLVTLGGVLVSFIGIILTGKAGLLKDKELTEEQKKGSIKEFNLKVRNNYFRNSL